MFSPIYQWTAKLRPNYDYTLLTSSHSDQLHEPTRRPGVFAGRTTLFKRWPRIYVILIVIALVIAVVSSYFIWVIGRGPLPPTFEEYREHERKLPQNNESLPLPEGKDGMYLLIENYSTHVGWGNLLEELIMHAFLAYSSKRALVLYEFIWDPNSQNYTSFNGKYIPSRLPISVTLAGPIAGGSMGPEHSDIPRAVSRDYFDRMCPDQVVVDADGLMSELQHATGAQITRAWVKKLDDIGHKCVVIPKGSSHIYNNILFGEPRMLDIWPELSQSPILQRFAWSPLIVDAYDRNRDLFASKAHRSPIPDALSETVTLPNYLGGLLVVHIRRGDFQGHCEYLQKQSCGYNAFNVFPEFSDRFEPPSDYWSRRAYYTDHCYPSSERIISKIESVRQKHGTFRRLYIMTNVKGSWLASLVEQLEQTASWDTIATSRDLNFTQEQRYASQALDALVAQRAEAFIGNGFVVEYQHAENGRETRPSFNLLLVIPQAIICLYNCYGWKLIAMPATSAMVTQVMISPAQMKEYTYDVKMIDEQEQHNGSHMMWMGS